jgi:hypothetical protein
MTDTIEWKADLHNHLGSNGINPGFDETIDMVHSRLGDYSMFGIADSDDNRYERFVEQIGKYERQVIDLIRGIYVPEKKIIVWKCQEMFTKEGDILAIAAPFGIPVKSKDIKDAMKEAKDLGASLDAVHPFCYQGSGSFFERNLEFLDYLSSWEVYNGNAGLYLPILFPLRANDKSNQFYQDRIFGDAGLHIGVSSSTDGHTPEVVGKCYTNLRLDKDFYQKGNSVDLLDIALRKVKSLDKLNMEPNKKDAFIHVVKMVLNKSGLRKTD